MKDIYIIGQPKPLTSAEVDSIQKIRNSPLPQDYKDFMMKYGAGTINDGALSIWFPVDEDFISNNFRDYITKLWKWENKEIKDQVLQQSITVGGTMDGDTICIINQEKPIVLLPRNSNEPLFFKDFSLVLEHCLPSDMFSNGLYFDPTSKVVESIKVTLEDKPKIEGKRQAFLQKYTPDAVFGIEKQPIYVLQAIGGWVSFDLVYRSSIRINYQSQFESAAKECIEFLKQAE